MKYQWGDAEVALNCENAESKPKNYVYDRFNIYMKDLLPKVREQLETFLTECKDPRASRLQDDFNIANVYSIKEVDDGPDLSVGR